MFPLKARVRNKGGNMEWMECIRETKRYWISQALNSNGTNIRYNRPSGVRVGGSDILQVATIRPVNVPFDLRKL